ncbi:MAG: 50S ribosomal protein L6 [bacterium]
MGKKPIQIPDGVKVTIDGRKVKVSGPKGELEKEMPPMVDITVEDRKIKVMRKGDKPREKAQHGLARAILANMIKGVVDGFKKELDVIGLGYRVENKGKGIILSLGYSHPIYFVPPPGITLEIETPKKEKAEEYSPGTLVRINVMGCDKELVGLVAAKIRSFRRPDAYKGKGIRYYGEPLRLKPGKTGGAGGK